jgi:hypothetical protein
MDKLAEREPRHATDFTITDVALALRSLALYGGNAARASQALAAEGRIVTPECLRKWQNEKYPVEYQRVVDELRGEIGSLVADGAMEIASAASDLEGKMMARLAEELHEVPATQLAKAALNMAQAKKTNVETARLLRDQPTEIVENRNAADAIEELTSLGVVVNAEAEELP